MSRPVTQSIFCPSALLAVTFVLSLINPVCATTDNELTLWNTVNIDIPITEKIYLREAVSPRLKETLSEMDVVLIRSIINYESSPDLVYSAAYDWFKVFNASGTYENRFWQQAYYRHDLPAFCGDDSTTESTTTTPQNQCLRMFHRVRIDERMPEAADTQVRLRYMIGLEYPLTKTITAQLADEVMVNTNSNARGEAGLDQNRIYLGLVKKFNSLLAMSIGYQFQHFFDDRDLINHGVIIALNFNARK